MTKVVATASGAGADAGGQSRRRRGYVRPVHVLCAATVGAVLGVVVSGLSWSIRDRSLTCIGGCSPADKDLPAGDLTLLAAALGGMLVAVGVLLIRRLMWPRTHS